MLRARVFDTVSDIQAGPWDALFGGDNPFVRHAFLRALEESGSVGAGTGWAPRHLCLLDGDTPVAAMPLYRKRHSFGEFVFDWSWAEAYARHGLAYYPKLLTAIPFTPSIGPRIGIAPGQEAGEIVGRMVAGVQDFARDRGLSGWHLLFPDAPLRQRLAEVADEHRLLQRRDVQFHWRNRGYGSFEDFLATFRSARRKTLKRERRLVTEQDVVLERKTGSAIGETDWEGFYRCYCRTYRKRSGHSGYLTRSFFGQLLRTMRDRLMLVVATRRGSLLASALFLYDSETLYGRYWGALEDVHCLHFEACFYQGIEFCIERGLARFDPGTQGEHKLLRGFEPFETTSWHWLADDRFHAALAAFLSRERRGTGAYQSLATGFLPYRKGS